MVSFDDVERALRRQTFGTLSTLTEQGTPHSTGVVYTVSAPDEPLILYVTTRTTTRKVRNIRAHANVAFVIPVPRRFVPAFPPRAIQFQGTATVVGADHQDAARAFASSWFLRRILATEQRIVVQGGDLCFHPHPSRADVVTYGMGMSVLRNVRGPRAAIGRVAIPADRQRAQCRESEAHGAVGHRRSSRPTALTAHITRHRAIERTTGFVANCRARGVIRATSDS